jgi:hypothetical protein
MGLTVLCLTGVTGRVSAQNHPLYHLHHALWELKDARIELKESAWQFGEHKIKAERAIDDGIRQIELILQNVGDFARGEPKREKFDYKVYAHHPHLYHSVVELRLAHKELKEARSNFGGHKDAALRDIAIAADQIELLLKNGKR